MSSDRLDLFVFVDALGWDLVQKHGFLTDLCPHRQSLQTVLGYSCACVPTILTGLKPAQHGHFAFYRRSEGDSPLANLGWMSRLPGVVTRSGRVRSLLSRAVAWALGYTGYFQLYSVPFETMAELDYSEKRDLYRPGGILNGAPTLFDSLEAAAVPHVVSDWRKPEAHNLEHLEAHIDRGRIRAAYLYLADLDALLHREGTEGRGVGPKLRDYERSLRTLVALAHLRYRTVNIHVFSDHGMTDVRGGFDITDRLRRAGLEAGRDYTAVLDSTMARFWVRTDRAAVVLRQTLDGCSEGERLTATRLEALGCHFPDGRYGEEIFLTRPGLVIHPSHMGRSVPTGMHGYDPAHPEASAAFLSSEPPSAPLEGLWNLKAHLEHAALH